MTWFLRYIGTDMNGRRSYAIDERKIWNLHIAYSWSLLLDVKLVFLLRLRNKWHKGYLEYFDYEKKNDCEFNADGGEHKILAIFNLWFWRITVSWTVLLDAMTLPWRHFKIISYCIYTYVTSSLIEQGPCSAIDRNVPRLQKCLALSSIYCIVFGPCTIGTMS